MRVCTAHGLRIATELPLPELLSATGSADVTIRIGEPLTPGEHDERGSVCRGTPEEVQLLIKDVGTFVVRFGREVLIHPAPGVSEQLLRIHLLGPALGTLLHQRGCLVLHASGVGGPRGAILFLGESGWGKSTTAATLHRQGWRLLTDDVAALEPTEPLRVLPGFPRCKLWPDAARSLGIDPGALPRIFPQFEKREHRIETGFHGSPMVLDRLYVLAEGPTVRISPLTPREAFIATVRHRYVDVVMDVTGTRPRHFQQVERLIGRVPVFRLSRPRRLDVLPRVIGALVDHFQSPSAAA